MGARNVGGGASSHRYAVVMAGGIGSRFWPHSRRSQPKQFLSVQGRYTLVEDTVRRLAGLVPDDRIYVVAAAEFGPLIREHLPQIPAKNLIVEPAARGTGPCLGLAARVIERRDPQAVIAVFAADHVIAPRQRFQRCVRVGFATAESERALVTFGIKPTGPDTGFGYIEVGRQHRRTVPKVFWVSRFVEKPDVATAKRYLRTGRYLWNSGMFVWRADVLREAIARYAPDIDRALDALDAARGAAQRRRAEREFARLRSVPIDIAVMEKSDRVAAVEADFDWNDVGSWAAMDALWPTDARGNSARGEVMQIDCRDTIASSDGRLIAMVGVEDLVVVESRDAILICPKSRAQDVRRIVDELDRRGDRKRL